MKDIILNQIRFSKMAHSFSVYFILSWGAGGLRECHQIDKRTSPDTVTPNDIGYVWHPAFCASGTEFRANGKMGRSTMVEKAKGPTE